MSTDASTHEHSIGHEEERENTTIMSALESQVCVLERDEVLVTHFDIQSTAKGSHTCICMR